MFNFEERKQPTIPCTFNLSVPVLLKNSSLIGEQNRSPGSVPPSIPHHCCSKSEPLMRDLVLYSSEISHCWKNVAYQLEIPNGVVRQIIADNQNSNDRCREMFQTWQDRASSPLCWCIFIQALYRLELNEIARKARKHLYLLPPDNDVI